ncbi:MAG: Hsp20/alpha crystallin family protein [Candidatus Omnitrophica bacterium]|nr:Hsp20/alpha crystallin family protein [Candidatus Omnitrophota bacterium]
MSSFSWSVIDEMERMKAELDRVLNGLNYSGFRSVLPGSSARRYPLLNVADDREEFVVDALVPGVEPASISITVAGDQLHVGGERLSISEKVKSEAIHRSERPAGKFSRSITLPAEVDPEKVTANCNNGLIRIRLPKSERAKPKAIDVKVG